VALLDTLEAKLLQVIKNFFAPVIGPLQKLWNILKGFFTALIDVVPETIQLVKSTIAEINAWRTFKEGISFKSGVINLQSVKDHIGDLVQELIDAWHALVDLFTSGFKLPLRGVQEAADAAEEVVTAIEEFGGKFGLREFLANLATKLEKAGGKVLEILALIQAVAEEALKVVRELQTIVNAVRDVRTTFQTGEGLFLSQKNPRRVETLQDGTKIKIRVGNLHQ
jgi:phage-related protein